MRDVFASGPLPPMLRMGPSFPHFAGAGCKALPREVGEGWVGAQRLSSHKRREA